QDPQVTWVRQHKLEGENLLGSSGVKMVYALGISRLGQQVQDQRRLTYRRTTLIGQTEYFQTPNIYMPNLLGSDYDFRLWTDVAETDYNWGVSFSKDFLLGPNINTLAKIGYSGWDRSRLFPIPAFLTSTILSKAAIGTFLPQIV